MMADFVTLGGLRRGVARRELRYAPVLLLAAMTAACAGQPMTGGARAAMDKFMSDHPRGRHGAVRYDMGQLGLDRAERRAALAFYTERFGLREEAAGG